MSSSAALRLLHRLVQRMQEARAVGALEGGGGS
jgi:hypothetical protein